LYGEQYRTFYDTTIITEGVFDVFDIGIGAVTVQQKRPAEYSTGLL
jgi:hypothetical protein